MTGFAKTRHFVHFEEIKITLDIITVFRSYAEQISNRLAVPFPRYNPWRLLTANNCILCKLQCLMLLRITSFQHTICLSHMFAVQSSVELVAFSAAKEDSCTLDWLEKDKRSDETQALAVTECSRCLATVPYTTYLRQHGHKSGLIAPRWKPN